MYIFLQNLYSTKDIILYDIMKTKILLDENDIPKRWYNIQADLKKTSRSTAKSKDKTTNRP